MLMSCVESYDFKIKASDQNVVIETYLSDMSFNESLSIPSDGKRMFVRLSYSSDVESKWGEALNGYRAILYSRDGNCWDFGSPSNGMCTPIDDDFHIESEMHYKLQVILPDDNVIESTWEKLPLQQDDPMGEITFKKTEKQVYKYVVNEKTIATEKGVEVLLNVPENKNNEKIYRRWQFEPMWQYTAPFASQLHGGKKCWITNSNFLNEYILQSEQMGGYIKELFFIPTEQNNRVNELFTVLVYQQTISEDYFNFWLQLQEQIYPNGIFDAPPSNLPTNFTCITDESIKVSGFFGLMNVTAKRWYFNVDDLNDGSFNNNGLYCQQKVADPYAHVPEECFDCRLYPHGDATSEKPKWWPE